MSSIDRAFAPGAVLGRYRIVAPIQEGGMATLHLASVEGSAGELVALKLMRPALAKDPAFVTMFQDEALLASRLSRHGHPNLVRQLEVGAQAGVHYIAMELIRGISLAQLLVFLGRSRRVLTPEIAVHIAIGVARALTVAHALTDEQGRRLDVIHRDVSPQNILLSTSGGVKLIDFGVAKAKGRNWETMQGSLKGKLSYMSPEQAKSAPVDLRADVYALGVVLWEALTGRRLFAGDPEAVLRKVIDPAVRPPCTYAPSIPRALDAAVMCALAPRSEHRFASCAAFEHALAVAVPSAVTLEPDALARLVATAMAEEIDDDVEESERGGRATVREMIAPRIDAPDMGRALQLHTREAVVSSGTSIPPAQVAPATRVLTARPPDAPAWQKWALFGAIAVLALAFSGVVVWGGLELLSLSRSAPGAVAVAPAPPAPETLAPPSVPVAAVENRPMEPTPTPDPQAVPAAEPTETEAEREHRTTRHGHRHRREGERGYPPPPPPPWASDEAARRVDRTRMNEPANMSAGPRAPRRR